MAGPSPSSARPPSTPPPPSSSIPQTLWDMQIPLIITHAAAPHKSAPFVASVSRFSYLALLLPRLSAYFGPELACSSFHHEDVLLRNLAVGLLADLYQPSLPWRLTVSDGVGWDIGDTFLNSAKEADFIRNGNAQRIMSLSKEHTTALWNAVQDNDYPSFSAINTRLLNTSRGLKHIPLRVYIPQSPADTSSSPGGGGVGGGGGGGAFRVVQSLVPVRASSSDRSAQTLGTALRTLLPRLFPSSRDPVLAQVILHGSPVPFSAPVDDLMREAAYPDGWLALVVVPLDV
ncbi:autophagy protein Apg5-domain-containing protein [Microdochium trichocladiopsis]|uniref:Autophagy protein 5 n=1 Tax=Microdochium trichocladiopsis TaxID=1682393 RepID=A0A9P9BK42_9PEZI|nr:autophagy protein Apg5-domain-containing protein [Microdochium trichocladiopsis]KAH7026244.1 autophagy protein Apg5-domain-containing protein [Microdochium trichocladiopsis]